MVRDKEILDEYEIKILKEENERLKKRMRKKIEQRNQAQFEVLSSKELRDTIETYRDLYESSSKENKRLKANLEEYHENFQIAQIAISELETKNAFTVAYLDHINLLQDYIDEWEGNK